MFTFKVYPKPSTGEFVTRFYENGEERKAARYYGSDRADATDTGVAGCARLNAVGLPAGAAVAVAVAARALKLDLSAAPRSTRTVNRLLRALGHDEILVTGRGYLYFADGDASGWYSSSVPVCRLRDLSLLRWVEEHAALKAAGAR